MTEGSKAGRSRTEIGNRAATRRRWFLNAVNAEMPPNYGGIGIEFMAPVRICQDNDAVGLIGHFLVCKRPTSCEVNSQHSEKLRRDPHDLLLRGRARLSDNGGARVRGSDIRESGEMAPPLVVTGQRGAHTLDARFGVSVE